jgi:hypothetical protein
VAVVTHRALADAKFFGSLGDLSLAYVIWICGDIQRRPPTAKTRGAANWVGEGEGPQLEVAALTAGCCS